MKAINASSVGITILTGLKDWIGGVQKGKDWFFADVGIVWWYSY